MLFCPARQTCIPKPNGTANPIDVRAGTVEAETTSFSPYAALAVPAPVVYSATVAASPGGSPSQTTTIAISVAATAVGVAAVVSVSFCRLASSRPGKGQGKGADDQDTRPEKSPAARPQPARPGPGSSVPDLPAPTRDVIRLPKGQAKAAGGDPGPAPPDWVSADLGVRYPDPGEAGHGAAGQAETGDEAGEDGHWAASRRQSAGVTGGQGGAAKLLADPRGPRPGAAAARLTGAGEVERGGDEARGSRSGGGGRGAAGDVGSKTRMQQDLER